MTEIVKTSNPITTPGEIKSQDKKKSNLFGYQGQWNIPITNSSYDKGLSQL